MRRVQPIVFFSLHPPIVRSQYVGPTVRCEEIKEMLMLRRGPLRFEEEIRSAGSKKKGVMERQKAEKGEEMQTGMFLWVLGKDLG